MRFIVKDQTLGTLDTLVDVEVNPASQFHAEFTSACLPDEINLQGYMAIEVVVELEQVKLWVRKVKGHERWKSN